MKRRLMTPRGPSQPGRGESGFTFVEILVALTVGAIVIAGMYQGFNILHKWWISTGIRSDMRQNARAGLETVTRDLEMAGYHATNYGDVNKTGLAITLAATHEIEMDQQQVLHTNGTIDWASPVYEPRLVYYHLATDMKSGRQHLYRQLRSQPGLPAPDELVAENVSDFTLAYLDRNNSPVDCLTETFSGKPYGEYTFSVPRPLLDTDYCRVPVSPCTTNVPCNSGLGPDPLKNIRRITVSLTTIPARAAPFGPTPKPFTLTASVTPQNLAAADELTADIVPPSVPTGLAVIDNRSCSNKLQARWNRNPEPDLAGYLLFYGPTDTVKVPVSSLSSNPLIDPERTLNPPDLLITKFADRTAAPNVYSIQILAYDSSGNRSEKSSPVVANPALDVSAFGGGNDTAANPSKPRPPTGLTVTVAEGELMLSWPPAGLDVVGYRLFRSSTPFVADAHIDGSLQIARETTLTAGVTAFNDTNLRACEAGNPRTYYYAIAAVNCDETLFDDLSAAGYHYNSSAALSDYTVASGFPQAAPLPAPGLAGSRAEERRVVITLTNPLESDSPEFDRTAIYWNKSTTAVPHFDGTVVGDGTLIPATDSGSPGIFRNRGSRTIVFDSDPLTPPVEPGATYNFLAVSYDHCGNVATALSEPLIIPASGDCADDPVFPPQDFFSNGTVSTCRPDSVQLGWQYPDTLTVPDLAGFRIIRTRIDVSGEQELTDGPTTLRSWTDAGPLLAGAAYTYTVTATDCVYERYLLDPSGSPLPYDLATHPLQTLVLGPVSPGGLRLYGVPSGDPAHFVTTASDNQVSAEPWSYTYHNNVKLWIENTSRDKITIEKMAVGWDNPNLVLARVGIGVSPSSPTARTIYNGGVEAGVEFAVHDAAIEDTAATAGSPSQAVPLEFRFTTRDGSVNRLVDLRKEVLNLSLWVRNEGFTKACATPTEVTIEVPRGPELGFFSQSAPGRDGIDSYAVIGPSGTARDTDIKVSSGVGVNVYGTAVDHSGMLFPDGINRGFAAAPAQLKVVANSVLPAASPAVPIMPTSGTADYPLERIFGDSYALSWPLPPDPAELLTSAPGKVHWYFALAVDKTGNWDRLPNPDYGNYAYFQTTFNVCGRVPKEPVLTGASVTADGTGVSLVWAAPKQYNDNLTAIVADDVLTYDVYYSNDGGASWTPALDGARRSSLRYDHVALTAGDTRLPAGTYRYVVKATNSCSACAGAPCSLPPSCSGDGCCSACSNESSDVVIP